MTSLTVRVPLVVRHRPGRKTIVSLGTEAGGASMHTRADPAMLKALARAFRWRRMLEDGRYASISEIAAAEKIDRGYVGSILRLTLLAPDIVEAILNGGGGRRWDCPGCCNRSHSSGTDSASNFGPLLRSQRAAAVPEIKDRM
jgi:hypothetical protein